MVAAVGQGKYEPLVNQEEKDYNDQVSRIPLSISGKRIAWDHIQNLDQFFFNIYKYHQTGGFNVFLLAQLFWLLKFGFVIFIAIELSVCTKWEYLSNNTLPVREWSDVFAPPHKCWSSLPFSAGLLVVGAVITILIQSILVGIRLARFWEIRRFCTNILDLPTTDSGLSDLTWSEVQRRLLLSQRDFQLCVYKLDLDELDIYNRILRHTNYLIAMINQDVIPLRFRLPFYPEHYLIYFPDGYLFNLKLILFWTPWSPFHNYWQLRADYKWVTKRHELACELAHRIRILGLINLLLSPGIFIAQLLTFACANAERLRYQPATLFGRRWSNYARLYLRHFNELRHEFIARVSQAYIPATRYLDSFVSRSLTVLAETGAFIFGGASVAFFIAGLVRDQIMHLPGYLAILVGGGLLARACLLLIPDENMVFCPRSLLISTLMRIHYMPDHWKDNAGTQQVRSEFAQLFQYRFVGLLEELLSPIITPIILIFILPNHTLEIVDFLRNYTVEVPGVGDVCSFAQLDIRRHGDPLWQPDTEGQNDGFSDGEENDHGQSNLQAFDFSSTSKQRQQDPMGDHSHSSKMERTNIGPNQGDSTYPGTALGGKTELSLMHFHLTNPSWRLPPDGLAYLKSVRAHALHDLQQQQQYFTQPTTVSVSPSHTEEVGIRSTPGLFNALYGESGSTAISIYQSLHPQFDSTSISQPSTLKNVAHLPGPGYIHENSMGVVGAMIESMKSSLSKSMQHSDPGVGSSDVPCSTAQRTSQIHVASKPSTSSDYNDTKLSKTVCAVNKLESKMVGSQLGPTLFNYSMLEGPTPVTMSLMAASALHSAEVPGLPFYQPYNSQTEEVLTQQLGLNSSLMGSMGALRYTFTEALTSDMSVSALYIHEIYHRRRQQRQSQNFGRLLNYQRSMIGSNSGVDTDLDPTVHSFSRTGVTPNAGIYTTSGFAPPYQLPYTSYATGSTNNNGNPYSSGNRTNVDRSYLNPANSTFSYGTMSGEPGIIRTPMDGRKLQNTRFAEVREEDENVGSPRTLTDLAFPIFSSSGESHLLRHPSGQFSTGGIVTLSSSPSVRTQVTQQNDQPSPSSVNLDSDHDSVPVWPDLPPTNC